LQNRMGWILTCLGMLVVFALGPALFDLAVGRAGAQAPVEPGVEAQAGPATGDEAARAQQEAEAARTMSVIDAEAREHFQLGRTFYDAGRFQQAAEEFEIAYKLSSRPQLLYNVYVARREAGGLPMAIDALRAYLAQVPDAPDRVNLEARLSSLEAQIARQQEQEAARAESERKAADAEAKANAPRTRTEKKHSVVPTVLMGTGGALLLGSAVTGGLALSSASDLDDKCGGTVCPSSQESKVDSTRTLAITTDVLWAVGGAAVATGLVLWLTGVLDSEHEVPVALGVTPTSISTQFSGRF
jgi:tetratricopeptide (TPR) repeat protein